MAIKIPTLINKRNFYNIISYKWEQTKCTLTTGLIRYEWKKPYHPRYQSVHLEHAPEASFDYKKVHQIQTRVFLFSTKETIFVCKRLIRFRHQIFYLVDQKQVSSTKDSLDPGTSIFI